MSDKDNNSQFDGDDNDTLGSLESLEEDETPDDFSAIGDGEPMAIELGAEANNVLVTTYIARNEFGVGTRVTLASVKKLLGDRSARMTKAQLQQKVKQVEQMKTKASRYFQCCVEKRICLLAANDPFLKTQTTSGGFKTFGQSWIFKKEKQMRK
jgi:hypothetical protein